MPTTIMQPSTKAIRTPFAVKDVDAEERTFEGLASTWDLDLGGDVIHRGAFKQTIGHWRQGGKVLPLIDQHNYGSVRSVVGKMVDAKETKDGLWTQWEVIRGQDGDEVLARVEGGYVDGLSIGYRPVKIEMPTEDEEREGVYRHLKEVELKEVSVVIWPMNPEARIDTDSIKAAVARLTEGELGDEDRAQLRALNKHIEALLAPEEAPHLTPEQRAELDRKIRQVRLARLRTGATREGEAALSGA